MGFASVLSGVAAALAAAGTLLVMANPPPDVVLAIALTAATVVFGVAAILLCYLVLMVATLSAMVHGNIQSQYEHSDVLTDPVSYLFFPT